MTLQSSDESAEWLPVVGYEGLYLVSNRGDVLSIRSKRILTTHKDSDRAGRIRIQLNNHGVGKTHKVSSLVARAFLGECPSGMEVCHNDGNVDNNCVSNLRYDTKSNNQLDRLRHGTNHNAIKTHCVNNHELIGANIYLTKEGWRQCRECRKIRKREWVERNHG